MRHLQGTLGLVALLLILSGVALAQTPGLSDGNRYDQEIDQPIRTPADGDHPDDDIDDDFPVPPPFFGEAGTAGEKMKIVWCLDRSGSMAWGGGPFVGPDGEPTTGSRWNRVQAETIIALRQLTPEWEFGIVTYACSITPFRPNLVGATAENVDAAIAWIMGQIPYGGTGIGPAQKRAFELASSGMVEGSATCWLLSDGFPNCGASGYEGHKRMALEANRDGHVLNTIGIGAGGRGAQLLRELAEATGGTYTQIN